jgi:hypothetical protein
MIDLGFIKIDSSNFIAIVIGIAFFVLQILLVFKVNVITFAANIFSIVLMFSRNIVMMCLYCTFITIITSVTNIYTYTITCASMRRNDFSKFIFVCNRFYLL